MVLDCYLDKKKKKRDVNVLNMTTWDLGGCDGYFCLFSENVSNKWFIDYNDKLIDNENQRYLQTWHTYVHTYLAVLRTYFKNEEVLPVRLNSGLHTSLSPVGYYRTKVLPVAWLIHKHSGQRGASRDYSNPGSSHKYSINCL